MLTRCLLPIGIAPLSAASLASGLLATLMKVPDPGAARPENETSTAGSVGMLIDELLDWRPELSLARGDRTVDEAGVLLREPPTAGPAPAEDDTIEAGEVLS